MNTKHIEALAQSRSDEEQPAPPPECKTDAEKTAFAFGWWKALEENRKPWVGLTEQDIDIAFDDTQEGGGFNEFAYAIEAKLKEKNGF